LKGKAKKVVERMYSAEKNLDETEAKELLNKFVVQFYENGVKKSETSFHEEDAVQYNYNIKGQIASIYFEFSDKMKPIIIDSSIYNGNNVLEKKATFLFDIHHRYGATDTWVETDTYKYNYSEYGDLTSIDHTYLEKSSDVPCVFCIKPTLEEMYQLKEKVFQNLEFTSNVWSEIPYDETVSKQIAKTDKASDTTYRYSENKESIKLEYTYDSFKNWTKCVLFAGSVPFRIFLREISYY
jgi:hypothetical protein